MNLVHALVLVALGAFADEAPAGAASPTAATVTADAAATTGAATTGAATTGAATTSAATTGAATTGAATTGAATTRAATTDAATTGAATTGAAPADAAATTGAATISAATTDAATTSAATTDAATTSAAPADAAAPASTSAGPGAASAAATVTATAAEKTGVAFEAGPVSFKLNAAFRAAQSLNSGLTLDDLGTRTSPTPFELRLRVGPELAIKRVALITEFDLFTGAVFGTPDSTIVAARVPTPSLRIVELRNAYFQYRWDTGAARLGIMTNQFGMGMLSNAGAKDPEPGDFGLQHGGVVVGRAAVAGRPLFGLGGAWRAVEPVAAFDVVVNDATANFLAGDRALQGILGLRFNVDEDHQVALTGVYRNQWREGGAPDERKTEVFVGDLYARWRVYEAGDTSLTLAGEVATILGKTTQGRSDTAAVLDVGQLGAIAKVNFKKGRWGLLLDGGFASGDQNPYDAGLNNFRFDANYKVGLVLFDQVLGYQSARSAWRASDPLLAGVPPEGIDLLPTAGAITGAWFLFPRARATVTDWMDLYGGPLFAFTTAQLVDPYNTRLSGGSPVNALGGRAGSYLGTELDLGLSVHGAVTKHLNVTAVLEGGVLLPGDAFTTASGTRMGVSGLGRLRLSVAL